MKDCNCNRSNQGRAMCPTPERCDAEEMHMADPQPSRWRWLAAVLRWILNPKRNA